MILLFEFGMVLTAWYFLFLFYSHNTNPGYRVLPTFSPGGVTNQIEKFKSN
jgi:hypothetical protein